MQLWPSIEAAISNGTLEKDTWQKWLDAVRQGQARYPTELCFKWGVNGSGADIAIITSSERSLCRCIYLPPSRRERAEAHAEREARENLCPPDNILRLFPPKTSVLSGYMGAHACTWWGVGEGRRYLWNTSSHDWLRTTGRCAIIFGDWSLLEAAKHAATALEDAQGEVAMETFDDDHEESWAYPGESGPKSHGGESEDEVALRFYSDNHIDDYDDYEEARRDPHWGVPYEDLYRDFTNDDVQEEW